MLLKILSEIGKINFENVKNIPLVQLIIILYVSGRDLQFNVESERQIFEKLFVAGLFALRAFARNLLRGCRRKNIFHITFLMADLGYEPRLLR